MSRKRILIFCFLVVLAVLLWWWLGRPTKQTYPQTTTSSALKVATPSSVVPQHPLQTAQALEEKRKGAIAQVREIFATPIEFYGQVIDQNGDPVPDADVYYGVIDKFYESGSDYRGKADASGNFSISGIKGAVLTVAVEKKGYYHIHDKSNASFGYGMGPDSHRKPPPTEENPAVFVLQKMGNTEPLIQVSERGYLISKNGTPVEVDLTTGQASAQGNIRVEAWTEDQNKSTGFHRYNWRCRVSVPNGGLVERKRQFDWRIRLGIPGGGLVERKEEFNFEAPVDGYQKVIEINMSATAEVWSSDVTKEYFVKLSDGRYARFSINFYSGRRNFVVIESYINPSSSSRNLELEQLVRP